jgi:helix-turn-helix protein
MAATPAPAAAADTRVTAVGWCSAAGGSSPRSRPPTLTPGSQPKILVLPGNGRTSHRARVGRSVAGVNSRAEVRDFLTTRRAKLTPERAGLPDYGGHRRVAGLRREEVALLAGVSVDHYTRVERGNLTGVSDGVLEALARGLQLDEAERVHLFDLARAANTSAASARGRGARRLSCAQACKGCRTR